MPHCNRRRRTRQIELLRAQFAQGEGLPFAQVLPAERVEQALAEEGAPGRRSLSRPSSFIFAAHDVRRARRHRGIGNIQTLERDYVNDAGQVNAVDQYFNLSGQTYTAGTMGRLLERGLGRTGIRLYNPRS